MTRLGQLLCAVRGHDYVLVFERGVMFLRCTNCRHETHGIAPAPRRPRVTWAGKPHRLRLAEPPALRRSA